MKKYINSLLLSGVLAFGMSGCGELESLLGEEDTGNAVTKYIEDKSKSDGSVLLDGYITDKLSGEPSYTDQEIFSIYLYGNPVHCTIYLPKKIYDGFYLPEKITDSCVWEISDTNINLKYITTEGYDLNMSLSVGDWYSEDAKSFKATIEDDLYVVKIN